MNKNWPLNNRFFAFKIIRVFLLLNIVMIFNSKIHAQDPEETEKRTANMNMNYFKHYDGTRSVTFRITSRAEGKLMLVSDLNIDLYVEDTSGLTKIGRIVTKDNGEATFILPNKLDATMNTLRHLTFIAKVENDEIYSDIEETVSVNEANFDVSFNETDTSKQIKVSLSEFDSSGTKTPVADAEIKFYVQRMFSLLPIGGDYTYTEEDGELIIDFPEDLPGDSVGNIMVFVKIEENETFGNLEVMEIVQWGIPVSMEYVSSRSLFAPRNEAPLYLLLIVNGTMIAVWGFLIYIAFQLVKIRRMKVEKD